METPICISVSRIHSNGKPDWKDLRKLINGFYCHISGHTPGSPEVLKGELLQNDFYLTSVIKIGTNHNELIFNQRN